MNVDFYNIFIDVYEDQQQKLLKLTIENAEYFKSIKEELYSKIMYLYFNNVFVL